MAPRPEGHSGRGAFGQVVERLTIAEPVFDKTPVVLPDGNRPFLDISQAR